MKIYTRTGDSGETGLGGGRRVPKDAPRIEALGAIDELNAAVGLVRANEPGDDVDRLLERIQHELFELSTELAAPEPAARRGHGLEPSHVASLEADIDRFEAGLAPQRQFILPTGSRAAAGLHQARAVCRRAERRLVATMRQGAEGISPVVGAYLNRLGDLLFVLARHANARSGVRDVPWPRQE